MEINALKISIIGAGKLAYSLISALLSKKYTILSVFTRSENAKEQLERHFDVKVSTKNFSHIPDETNLILICVNDQNIPTVVRQILSEKPSILPKTTFLHTSGSVPLEELDLLGENIGILYPLQTFTKEKIVLLQQTPIFFEGKGNAKKIAQKLAENLSQKAYFADSTQRKQIHIGAVFACNFTHYMYRIAEKLVPENADFSIYQPLIMEQLAKVFEFGAENTQTGPAQRGDIMTIAHHLQLLDNQKDWQEIYEKISHLINPNLKLHK